MFKMTPEESGNTVQKGNFTPADSFINLAWPSSSKSGKTALGHKGNGVPLTVDKAVEKSIVDSYEAFMAAGRTIEEFNIWLNENLIAEYRPNVKGGGASVDESLLTPPAFLQEAQVGIPATA